MKLGLRTFVPLAMLLLAACGSEASSVDAAEDAVVVNTSTPAARAQYDADVAFALKYKPTCRAVGKRPRVLVTGFGRFLDNGNNATGRIIEKLVPAAVYPQTTKPAAGKVDNPEPQTSVAMGTLVLPRVGEVDVCAMIVPVYWDLASILIAKEAEAFDPTLVMMNGIAGETQDLWIELGSVNRAMSLADGSDTLRPVTPAGKTEAPLIASASPQDEKKGLFLSWNAVKDAATSSIEAAKGTSERGHALGDILLGAKLGGYPRSGNTYLCNNVTYVTNYLMAYPGRSVTLLKASTPASGKPNFVRTQITRNLRAVPRVFVHWPSMLVDYPVLVGEASKVMASMIDAQLDALAHGGEAPSLGKNAQADVTLSGDTF